MTWKDQVDIGLAILYCYGCLVMLLVFEKPCLDFKQLAMELLNESVICFMYVSWCRNSPDGWGCLQPYYGVQIPC